MERRKMFRGLLPMAVLVVLVLGSCAENLADKDTSTAPEKGSFLVIDENNKVLNQVSIADKTVKKLMAVGSAANDIEIDGNFMYIIYSMDNMITKVNLTNGFMDGLISFDGSPNPYAMSIDGNKIYVSLAVSNQLSVIDATSFAITTNIDLSTPGYPEGVAYDANNIYVATSAGYFPGYTDSRVVVLAKSNYGIVTNISVATNPQSVAVDANGDVFVACTGKGFPYSSGGLMRIQPSANYATNMISNDIQVDTVKYNNGKLYALDNSWGTTKSGLMVFSTNGDFITNIFAGVGLKGLDFDDTRIFLSHAYSTVPTNCYFIDKSDYSTIATIANAGGGDAVLYQ